MPDEEIDWDEEFAGDPDWEAIPPDQRMKLIGIMEKMLKLGMAGIYGDEDEGVPEAKVDCASCQSHCQARCCTLIFALTKEEVEQGLVQYNKEKPFFIARDAADGYCPHLDRETYRCGVWDDRPLRCRRYDCRDDERIWPQGVPDVMKGAFPGLV